MSDQTAHTFTSFVAPNRIFRLYTCFSSVVSSDNNRPGWWEGHMQRALQTGHGLLSSAAPPGARAPPALWSVPLGPGFVALLQQQLASPLHSLPACASPSVPSCRGAVLT